jgi:hypothetical protein
MLTKICRGQHKGISHLRRLKLRTKNHHLSQMRIPTILKIGNNPNFKKKNNKK